MRVSALVSQIHETVGGQLNQEITSSQGHLGAMDFSCWRISFAICHTSGLKDENIETYEME